VATILSMPKWGLAMKTGRVVEWLKHVGEPIQQGEPMVEIESEKATNEVDAPATGTLRWIGVQEGEHAPVGASLAVIAAQGEELTDEQVATLLREEEEARQRRAEMLTKQRAATKAATPATARRAAAPTGTGGRVNASPAARRLAQELGVDLTTLVGTGPGGMIGREDVLRASEEAQAPSAEVEEQSMDVAGVSTHYLLAGPPNAPHVVFVHGLGGSIATWALNLPAFAEQFRICALDLVGAGDSAKPETDYSVAALTDFLARFLDALGSDWQQVSIVAHSLGGAVALTFAQRYPDRVQKLVLIDSAGLGSEIDPVVLNLMKSEPTPEHIGAELACFFSNADLVQQALIDQVYQQRTQPGAHQALVATSEAAFAGGQQHIDLRETLAALPRPSLIVWGIADKVIPVAHAQEAQGGAQSRIEAFADCGHCPHIEHSETFNQLVRTFLSE
jgi:pimeloyl-ACP methyl ester carboxylesterase